MATIYFKNFEIFPHHIALRYQVDHFPFQTVIYYPTIDLHQLQISKEQLERLVSHIALFEGMKFCALFPESYDITPLAGALSENALSAFSKWFPLSWSQHLFENRSDYKGPKFIFHKPLGKSQPIALPHPQKTLLISNGGGKDSLLSMKMVEERGIPYASYQWARTEYGRLREQHRLMSKLRKHTHPVAVEEISVFDDFTDSTFLNIYHPEIQGEVAMGNPCQVGTPEGLLEGLLLCVAKGYSSIVVANERSASKGNLKGVNHQWIKSFEAETAFRDFIHKELIQDLNFFSLLRPFYDWQIFQKLVRYPEVLPDIHSCNVQKPWCKRCAKCAYVWMNLMARFPKSKIDALFFENLFDVPELQLYFRQLMGLEEHNAFECVGEINESRLALKRCVDLGLKGKAIDTFCREILEKCAIDWEELEKKYNSCNRCEHHIPHEILELKVSD